MATMLQIYVDFLLPANRPTKSIIHDRHVVSLPTSDQRKTAGAVNSVAARFKSDESPQRIHFRTVLADVFKDVLTWRMELSLGLFEHYNFIW